jgi:DNA repair exonuclease SbcCD nuclease subunit
MKRLVLGDIHGHWDSLKEIYDKENPDAVIILGDYFDNFHGSDESIGQCFDNILELRNDHVAEKKGPFILLIGNHDFHYNHWFEKCSGYRSSMAAANAIRLNDNDDLFQFIYIDEVNHTIYSHAGITNTWLKENMGEAYGKDSYKDINKMNHRAFQFTYKGGSDYYGNSIYQSPIWVRPMSLNMDSLVDEDGKEFTQIVGHTHCDTPFCYNFDGNEMPDDLDILNDNPDEIKIYIMDTMPKYYIVEELDENTKKLIKREIKINNLK